MVNGRPTRILLLMPEIGARRGGGIYQVGCSLLRLLNRKHCERGIDCRVLSLGRPDDGAKSCALRQDWGERLTWYGNRRLAFSRAAFAAMASWADLVIITHVGLASLLPFLPRRIRRAAGARALT